ncbi:MAG TPA: adenosylcobinamide amidohydrolase [Thermoanaerobacterales bacterium]|nr:adenosylcobinamide amidohydrolase [Thermoanaerobacterales bacterium]
MAKQTIIIDESLLKVNQHCIVLSSPIPLQTLSSAICGAGAGMYTHFINRHVSKDYKCINHKKDMEDFITSLGYNVDETIGMMTAVNTENVSFKLYNTETFSFLIVVTAGVGNAVDATKAHTITRYGDYIGTINTWIFINGKLSKEAFVQSVMTATEAKTKVLSDLQISDAQSNTIATGTSTDSILIAATQSGANLPYAGTATPLGKLIGKAIYHETKRAILNGSTRK